MRISVFAAILTSAVLLGCPPTEPSGTGGGSEGGGSGGGFGGGTGGGNGLTETAFPQCTGQMEKTTRAMLQAVTLLPLTQDGTFEIPVSPLGCVRLVQTVEGGKLKRVALRQAWGALDVDIPADGNFSAFNAFEAESTLYEELFTADGMHGEYFKDLGYYVRPGPDARRQLLRETLDVTWTSTGQLVSQMYRQLQNDEVFFEVEQTPVGTDKVRAITRWMQSTALEVVSDVTGPARMAAPQCSALQSSTPDSAAIDCTPAERMLVEDTLKEGLSNGLGCLQSLQQASSDEINGLDAIVQRVKMQSVKCYTGGETAGYISGNDRNPKSGASTINVNTGMFTSCDATFQRSTLFHEVLHIIRGPHNEVDEGVFDLPQGSVGALTAALTDSLRSCEEFCFGDPANRTSCMCARCLNTKACDDRCQTFGTCVVRNDAGVALTSEAVGAMCFDPVAGTGVSWHKTEMACQSSCTGGGTCKSYSVSCDPFCK